MDDSWYNSTEMIQNGGEEMATIKDVAAEAGVSVGTVSRYLNGADIKERNKIRIEEAISKLGFKINPIARCLKMNKTDTIGVIIPNLADIYATTIVRNLEKTLYAYGYHIIACDSWGDKALEIEKVRLLMDRMVDGLILYPCNDNASYLKEVNLRKIPVVVVDTAVQGYACDQVLTDNSNATYAAAEWLIKNNHKRIGFISSREISYTARERIKGYYRAHADCSLEVDRELVKDNGYMEMDGYSAMKQFLSMKHPPTAVIASNYYTTLGAMKAIYDEKIPVPEKVSVIGFDNLGLSEVLQPPLSIVTQPMEEIGRKAAEIVIKRIRGEEEDFPLVLQLQTEMVLRSSTCKAKE